MYANRKAVVFASDPSIVGKAFFPAIIGEDWTYNEHLASIVETHLLTADTSIAYPDACLAFEALESGKAFSARNLPLDTTNVYEELSILTTELDVYKF